MGGRNSSCDSVRDAELHEQVAALPPPVFLDEIWMASCRRPYDAANFAEQNLLFQPDCRNFCTKGLACKIQHTPEVEYLHASKEALDLQAKEDKATQSATIVFNAPRIKKHVNFVRLCWSLKHDAAGTPLAVGSLPQQLRDRTIVVFVHGFRQTYYRNISLARHMKAILDDQSRVFQDRLPATVTFLWPACFNEASYVRARGNAWHARAALRELLSALQSLNCRIVIVGHSLGCKASLTALHNVPENEVGVLPCPDEVSHLILLSPAVGSDALCSNGRFPRASIKAEQITVVSSERDNVLRDYFRVGELASGRNTSRAMGLVGPDQVPPGVNWLKTDISHNENAALGHKEVRQHIVAAAAGTQLDDPRLTDDPESPSSVAWSYMATLDDLSAIDVLSCDTDDFDEDQTRLPEESAEKGFHS